MMFGFGLEEAELFHFIAKGIAGDIQEAGGQGLIVRGLAQGEGDEGAFDGLERGAARWNGERREVAAVLEGKNSRFGKRVLRGGDEFEGGDAGGSGEGEGQAGGAEERIFLEDHGAFDGVTKFADIAGPIVGKEQGARLGGEAGDGLAEFSIVVVDIEIDDGEDIFLALAERGKEDGDDGEAVKEVLAELRRADGAFEVAIGSGDDADIGLDIANTAEAPDDLVIEDAEELGLEKRGQLANFIEEEGAAVGDFKETAFEAAGIGEGAFFVAEEFGLHEGFRDGGPIDGDEGLVTA